MKSKVLGGAAAILFVLGLSACQHGYPIIGKRRTVDKLSPWQGFGGPAENTVQVIVAGDVQHPGTYHFPRGSNIANACTVAGAFEAGYGHGEPIVYLTRQDGKRYCYDPRQKLILRREAANLELREDDRLVVGRFYSMHE
jgi:hypothetical protein